MVDPLVNKPWTVLSCGLTPTGSPVLRIMDPTGNRVMIVHVSHKDFAKLAECIPARSYTNAIPGVNYG